MGRFKPEFFGNPDLVHVLDLAGKDNKIKIKGTIA
jgi:hypothetical protein